MSETIRKCKHGHDMTEENTIQMKAGGKWNGKTQCRQCKRDQSAASRVRRAPIRKAARAAKRAAAQPMQAAE